MAKQCLCQRGQVALCGKKALRHGVHQVLRRIIGDKMASQFGGEVFCTGRVLAQIEQQVIQCLRSLRVGFAHHHLVARLVKPRHKLDLPTGLRRQAPTGEQSRSLRYVLLCISAVDAQRVQLKQFPRQVLVEALVASAPGR